MFQNIYYERYKNRIHLWDDQYGYKSFRYKKYAYKKQSTGSFISLYGDKLTKIYKWDEEELNLFESDINPEVRTLIDEYTNDDTSSVNHKIMIIDIEVEVTAGFPRPDLAENKIYSITIYDSFQQKYFCFVLDEKNRMQNKKEENLVIEVFNNERDLITRFFKEYLKIKPTIITGWNSTYFDIPYVYNRTIQILGSDVALLLSPIKQVQWNDHKDRYFIAGVSCLDYLMLYKKFTPSQKPSYRLNEICKTELNLKKLEYDGTLNDLYENDIQKFVDYNIHDVRLVKKLDKKLDFIEIARGICHIGHIPYEDVFFSSRYLDGAILVYLKQLNIIAPSRTPLKIDRDKSFEGAFVLKPQCGRYKWVYDLDIVSEYPNVIRSLNISPETKIGKISNWDVKKFLAGNKKSYSVTFKKKPEQIFSEVELKNYFEENKVSISINGILYKTDKRGLIPTILTRWFDQRMEFRLLANKFNNKGDKEKYEYFDRRQALQKILLNSLYGTLGLPSFRFYDLENAEAVTTTGQALIKFSKKIINHYYNEELGDRMKITLEDGSIKTLFEHNTVIVMRNGKKHTILANDLKIEDNLLE